MSASTQHDPAEPLEAWRKLLLYAIGGVTQGPIRQLTKPGRCRGNLTIARKPIYVVAAGITATEQIYRHASGIGIFNWGIYQDVED